MRYCVYKIETGEIRQVFDTRIEDASKQLGQGEAIYVGDANDVRHRIDHASGERFEYISPQPSDKHEFNRRFWVWTLNEEAQAKADKDIAARKSIAELENKQARVIREERLGYTGAADRLAEIDSAIKALRTDLIEKPSEQTVSK